MPDSKVILNYEDIIDYIGEELRYILQELISNEDKAISSLISNIKSIEISDEQHYKKQQANKQLNRGTVYLVVRFRSGPINFASSVTPIAIYALGVANQVKPVQLLLGTFASFWTTKNMLQGIGDEIKEILQVWNTPEVVSNFNVSEEDFRNLYSVTGNIVIGPKAVRLGTLTYYYGDSYQYSETVNIMSFHDGYHASLDSQPFGDTGGFAESEVNFSTYTFSVSTYLLEGQLARDSLAVRGFRYRPNNTYSLESGKFSIFDPNQKVKVKLEFTNGFTNAPGLDGPNTPEAKSSTDPVKGDDFYTFYKIVDSQIGQELAGIPSLTITFAR